MIKLVEIIKKHKALAIICIIAAFALPLVVIQLLFEYDSGVSLFQAKWSAGDSLAYVMSFCAFFGTIFLGAVAAYQSEVAQNYTRKISEENLHLQKIMCQKLYPVLRIKNVSFREQTVRDRRREIPQSNQFYYARLSTFNLTNLEETNRGTTSGQHFIIVNVEASREKEKNRITCLTFDLVNNSEAVIKFVALEGIVITGYQGFTKAIFCDNEKPKTGIPTPLNPGEKISININFVTSNFTIADLWEDELAGVGFCLFTTNSTITGIHFHEFYSVRMTRGNDLTLQYGEDEYEKSKKEYTNG